MILVTGGAGYIRSHACVELPNAGEDAVVLEDFFNSNRTVLERMQEICSRPLAIVEADIRDQAIIETTIVDSDDGALMHFASLKSGDLVACPHDYYDDNFVDTHTLLRSWPDHRNRPDGYC